MPVTKSFHSSTTSREVGDWWQVMRTQDADVDHLLTEYEPLRLAPVPLEGTNRQEVFKQACHAFAPVRGKSVPQREVDLEDARFGRMLYLHMAALAAVDELPISASGLLEDTVSHEQRYWSKQFAETYASRSLDSSKFTAGARRTVAAITLLGGVPTIDAAEELKARIAGPDEDQFCSFVSWLYPGRDEIGVQDRFIRGLEPDLLGEELVRSVLSDRTTSRDFLDQVFFESVRQTHGLVKAQTSRRAV